MEYKTYGVGQVLMENRMYSIDELKKIIELHERMNENIKRMLREGKGTNDSK
jgi:hypothetical protein